jgi:integrase
VERYVAQQDAMLAEGKIARVTHKKNCPKAKMFGADFGLRSISEVRPAEISEWIDDLGFEAAETYNTYRKVLHALFESGREECPTNPVSTLQLRSDQHDVGLITVEQTEALLAYALKTYREIVPRLALECFAGIRFSSAFRLERGDINFEDKGITLPAHKLKTRRRHYIDGLPKSLFLWIALETPATWCISPREYRRLKSACFDEAQVPHPHNCLRHNFATYHLAAFKNPGLTATILCHRDQQLLWSTYNGRATHRDGLRYFELRPTTEKHRAAKSSTRN